MNFRFFKFLPLILSFSLTLSADEGESLELENSPLPVEMEDVISKTYSRHKSKKLEKKPIKKGNHPYFIPMKSIGPNKEVFFQQNIGLGLLYFHKVQGNLAPYPSTTTTPATVPYKRGLSYNRTPLIEYLVGYRFFDWFKLAFSYQNQSGIFIQTDQLPYFSSASRHSQFRSYLSFNSIMAKCYFEPRYGISWQNTILSPFLAFGLGLGWQTWVPQALQSVTNTPYLELNSNSQAKYMANAVWVLDKGLRIQPATQIPAYTAFLGLKFMFWGQARNLNKLKQQDAQKFAYFKPFKIKTIYSFVPYLGFQWNFPASQADYPPLYKVPKSEMDTVFINSTFVQQNPALVTELNFGPNFIYFSGIKGNLAMKPSSLSVGTGQYAPYNKPFNYNRAPLYEYFLGCRLSSSFKFGLSAQTQTNIVMRTPWTKSLFASASVNPQLQLQSYLNLTSLMGKFYLSFPYGLRAKFVVFNPYLAMGLGASWQNWSDLVISYNALAGRLIFVKDMITLKQKTIANPSFMVDLGFNMTPLSPAAAFSLTLGCRYNQWGQVRNLGKMSQQDNLNKGLVTPINVKTLYSFTPYFGFQWDFPVTSNAFVDSRNAGTYKPYLASSESIGAPSYLFAQINMGPNFLRFSGVKGNLSGEPIVEFDFTGSVPVKNRLEKNASLLFEYLLGYQMNSWLKFASSFQMQQGLYVATNNLHGYSQADITSQRLMAKLGCHLSLYSLMAKTYFEAPYAMIWKSLATTAYGAFGFGPSWQSWAMLNTNYNYNDATGVINADEILTLRPKVCANMSIMVDLGLKIQNANAISKWAIFVGCKYNQWGQARNLGKITQQWDNFRIGIFKPLTIKTVYSFAPYLGFQWNF